MKKITLLFMLCISIVFGAVFIDTSNVFYVVPTDTAGNTYIKNADSPTFGKTTSDTLAADVTSFNALDVTFGTSARILTDINDVYFGNGVDVTNDIVIETDNKKIWLGTSFIDSAELQIPKITVDGTSINEFSIDGTLAGNSDITLTTEKAIKTYVDNNTREDTSGISVTVGPSGEYSNINDAISHLQSNYYPAYESNADFVAQIVLQNDFVMDEQVLINGIDLGWIELVGEASSTQFSITSIDTGSFYATIDTIDYYYAKFNITSHGFEAGDRLIIKDQLGYSEEEYYNGIWTVDSVATNWIQFTDALMDSIKAGAGGTGAVQELVTVPVNRSAMTANFEYFYYPAFGVARGTLPTIGCIFEMDASANAHAGHQSYIDGLCATDNGRINILPYCGFRKADGSNIYGTRGSVINANDAIADSAGRHGIWAYSNTLINARRSYVANCGWNDVSYDRGDGWLTSREPSGAGIVSTRGSIINAEGSTVINTLGHCISSSYGGTINIGNTDEYGVIAGGSANGKTYNSEPGGILTGADSYGRGILEDGYKSYYDIDDNPGNNYLIAGNEDCGFFGEVTVGELLGTGKTADTLMSDLDITQGTAINTTENWLKFIWNGKILYYPQKPIRHSISWDHIYLKGCVYGTDSTISSYEQTMLDDGEASDASVYKVWIAGQTGGDSSVAQIAQTTINGKTYRVRLMKGTNADLPIGTYGRDDAVGNNNEWNRLILPLYEQTLDYSWSQVVTGNTDYSAYVNTTTPDWDTYYTDQELVTHHSYGPGSYNWMQEFTPADVRGRVGRGSLGASHLGASTSWVTYSYLGLRLVLEEI